MSNENVVPTLILDWVRNLFDKKLNIYIRQNYRGSLMNVRNFCTEAIEKFDAQATKEEANRQVKKKKSA